MHFKSGVFSNTTSLMTSVCMLYVGAMAASSHKYVPRRYFFSGSFMFFSVLCLLRLCASVYMSLVVTCRERAYLYALVCGVQLWVCHFPIGTLGQVWYLIVSIPDLCTLTYFKPYVYLYFTTSRPSMRRWSKGCQFRFFSIAVTLEVYL